jgi:pimeloyl-ACP methyl ester carboxylesterase
MNGPTVPQESTRATMPTWAQRAAETPSSSHWIDVDGCATHYLTWGEPAQQPLVLVHGNGAHAEWWRFIAPLLLPDYYVIALDLAGMGDSGRRDSYPRESYVEQVIAVAKEAAPGRAPYVVGHSLGGFVTILTAAAHGAELAGAIVIDSPIHPLGKEPERPWRHRVITNSVYPDLTTALARFRLIPDQPCMNRFVIDHIARHSLTQAADGWTWKFDPKGPASLSRRSYVNDLLGAQCPTALLWGADSALFPPEVKDYMRRTFSPRIPLVEIADAYHHVLLDQPIALAAVIRTQLANWSCTNVKGTGT